MPSTYTFRFTQEGLDSFKAMLDGLGPAGEAAFQRIADAAPGMASAVENAQARAAAATKKLVAQSQSDFTALQASLNPAIAAQQKLADGRAVITAAQNLGVASDAQAAAALAQLEQRFGSATAGVSGFGAALGSARDLLGAFGLALGIQQVVAFGEQVFQNAAALDSQAKQAGVSVTALQAYRAVMVQSGLDAGTADAIVQHMTRSIGEATNAAGLQRTAFAQLGLGAQDLAGGTESVLPQVASSLLDIKDASTRAQIEIALFGKAGQDVEAALQSLTQPTQDLIDQQTKLGQVMGTDLAAATDKATREMTASWGQLEVQITPIITTIATTIAELIQEIAGIGSFPSAVLAAAQAAKNAPNGKIQYGAPAASAAGGAPTTDIFGASGIGSPDLPASAANAGTSSFSATPLSYTPDAADAAADASAQQNLALEKMSVLAKAQYNAEAARANQIVAEHPGILGQVNGQLVTAVRNQQDINEVLSPQQKMLADQTAQLELSNKAAVKIKETLGGYLAQLDQAAAAAGLSTAQRQAEDNVIKAAVIDEKAHGVAAKDTSKTYADAVAYLGQQTASLVELKTLQAALNALTLEQTEQITTANAGLAVDADHRALVVQNLQDELKYGIATGAQYAANRATLEANNALIQSITDQTKFDDYIANLKEEVSLAGLATDAREQQEAVLQQMHATHGTLTQDQADEVAQLVAAKQQAEEFGKVATGVTTDFQNALTTAFEGGKDAFGNLMTALKNEFAQLLAWMVTQAIAQPIIVPIIESITGQASGIAGVLGSGGTGGSLLGSLGTASSIAGSTGGTGFLGGIGSQISSATNWLTSGIDSIGADLGFGTTIPGVAATANSLGLVTSIGATSVEGTSSILGGLGSLSGLLGAAGTGLGIGGLATMLTGGNSMGGNIGGLIGGLAGSIIPGLGTIVGSILGGVVGGMFGPTMHPTSTASFDGNDAVTGYGGKNATSTTNSDIQSASGAISGALQALAASGVTLTNTIDKLAISTNKASMLTTDDGSKINVGKRGDVDAAISGSLNYLLQGASSANPDVSQVLSHYNATGGITSSNVQQFESDIQFAQSLATTSHQVTVQLGDAADALAQVQTAYDADITRAKSLGLSTAELLADEQTDIQAMAKATSDAYVSAFQSITSGLQPLDSWQAAAKSISDTLTQATSDMDALGGSLTAVSVAAKVASATLAAQFNAATQTAIDQLVDPVKAAMDALIATQNQRLADAEAVGADVSAVLTENRDEMAAQLQTYADAVTQAQAQVTAAQTTLNAAEGKNATAVMSVSDAQSELQNAYSAQSQTINDAISKFGDLVSSLDAYAAQLGGTAISSGGDYGLAKSTFEAIAQAALGGDSTALGNLQSAGEAFLSASQSNAASAQDYARDQSAVRDAVTIAAATAQNQVTVAQQQLTALDASVSGLIAINDNVVGVKQAIADLALSNEAQQGADYQALANAYAAKAEAENDAATAYAASGNLYLGGLYKTASQSDYGTALGYAYDASKLPHFAAGGMFDGGLRVVGENGPELERTGPSRIYSNTDSRALFDLSPLIAEVKALRAEQASMRQIVETMRGDTKQTADIFRRVTRDGNSLLTSAA